MGYMKQIIDEDQARVDQVVRWWKEHENAPMPAYLIKAIVEDAQFFEKVAELWEHDVPPPIPATRHVALQEERRRRKPKADWSMSHNDAIVVLSLFTFTSVIALCLTVWLAVIV